MSDVDPVPPLLEAAAAVQRRAGRYPSFIFAERFAKLGALSLALRVTVDTERERTNQATEQWFAELAVSYGMLGRREDVERLAAKCDAAPSEDLAASTMLAVAFEWIVEEARADAYLARLALLDRIHARARMVRIAVGAGRLARAEALVTGPEPKKDVRDPDLWLAIARGHGAAGDAVAAKRWLDRAAELPRPPDDFTKLGIAIFAGELGDTALALKLARAFDRATYDRKYPYNAGESVELAQAYVAGGRRTKAEKIVDAYAVLCILTLDGYLSVVKAYASLGLERGLVEGQTRRLALDKIVARAEAMLGKSSSPDDDLGSLAIARATIGSLAPAIEHALAIAALDRRASILVRLAEIIRGRRFEATPELTAAIARLAADV